MSVEPRQLRHAIALAQHKSFRLAAQVLGLTQSALTKSIQLLEAELGVKLFDRMSRSVEPTAFGEAVVARAAPILAGLGDLDEDLRRLRGLDVGAIAFGAGPAIAAGALGSVIGDFTRRHPGIRVRVLVRDWPALVEALRRHAIEFFVGDVTALADDPMLEIGEVLDHLGLWLCRAAHPLARQRKVSAEQIAAYPIASPRLPPAILAAVRAYLGRERPDETGRVWEPELQAESFTLLRRAVLASDAVVIGTRYAHVAELRSRELVALRVSESPLRTRLGAVRLRGRTLSPAADALLAPLLALVREELGAP
jgi:DNA-binding transcriptional LysR family regulator